MGVVFGVVFTYETKGGQLGRNEHGSLGWSETVCPSQSLFSLVFQGVTDVAQVTK
jgi:hypothetical protein